MNVECGCPTLRGQPLATIRKLDGRCRRGGAVLVEAAIIMSVLVMFVLGTIDLSLAVSRYNMLSAAARQGAREAIVHGQQAPPRRSAWGPSNYAGHVSDGSEIAQAIRPALVGVEPEDVSITMSWPDGSNAEQMRVQCTVATTHRLLLTSLFTDQELALSATSTMRIAH